MNNLISTAIGNLGRDAEWKSENGREYGRFSMACNDRNAQGEDITTWVNVFYSQPRLTQHLRKGAKVVVVGAMRLGTYRTRDGQTAIDATISARMVNIVKYAGDGSDQAGASIPGAPETVAATDENHPGREALGKTFNTRPDNDAPPF